MIDRDGELHLQSSLTVLLDCGLDIGNTFIDFEIQIQQWVCQNDNYDEITFLIGELKIIFIIMSISYLSRKNFNPLIFKL